MQGWVTGTDHEGFKTNGAGGGEAVGFILLGTGKDDFRTPAAGTDRTEQSNDSSLADNNFIIRADGGTIANTVFGHGEGLGEGGEFEIEPLGDGE